MWYVAHLLFAQKPQKGRRRVMCETCRVLFRTASANECYRRAQAWAKTHAAEGGFRFVGVQHINILDKQRPGDGAEIGGSFFHALDVWKKKDKLIPKKQKIPIIRLEGQPKAPVGKIMSRWKKRAVREIFGGSPRRTR